MASSSAFRERFVIPAIVVTADNAFTKNTSFVCNSASLITLTLPSTANVGDVFEVTTINTGAWRIAQNASQTIYYGSTNTTTGVGGYLQSSSPRAACYLKCVVQNLDFQVYDPFGAITVV